MTDIQKRAVVLIAGGTEEMEAVIVVDVLRRAKVDDHWLDYKRVLR